MSFFNTKEVAFGLDISNTSLRLIQLRHRFKTCQVQLYNEIKLPPGIIDGGEIKNNQIFLDSLNKLIKTRHGHGRLSDEVVAVLPEEKTFIKFIEINTTDQAEIEIQLKEKLSQAVPLDISEAYFDWQILNQSDCATSLLVGISPKKIIDSYVQILTQANLIPTVLEIEAAAIARTIIDDKTDKATQIIIDIGANRTGLFLYDGAIKFTISLPVSGDKITQLIANTLELDFARAEQAKIVCGLDKDKFHGALFEIFTDSINELAQQINSAIAFYKNNFSQPKKIEKITLCGGGANFLNIANVLKEKIGLPVMISNPWQHIAPTSTAFFSPTKSQSFVTALGLGLRGLNPETFL